MFPFFLFYCETELLVFCNPSKIYNMVSWDNTQFTLKKSVFGAEYFSDDSMNNKKTMAI